MMGRFEREAAESIETFARMLTKREWHYKRNDGAYSLHVGVAVDALPMDIIITADPDHGILRIFSKISVTLSKDKIMEAAIIVNELNEGRLMGNFDLNITSGSIFFKVYSCIADCTISEGACGLLLDYAVRMVDDYNRKFLLLNKGVLSMEDILSAMDV